MKDEPLPDQDTIAAWVFDCAPGLAQMMHFCNRCCERDAENRGLTPHQALAETYAHALLHLVRIAKTRGNNDEEMQKAISAVLILSASALLAESKVLQAIRPEGMPN